MNKEKRANNSLSIYFKDKQHYLILTKNLYLFIKYVVSYIKSIGFELVHRKGCHCSFSLTRFCCYHRKRNGNIIIWRLQCTRCKKTFSVLPNFVLRYRGLDVSSAQNALYGFYYGLSLEVCSNLFNISPMQQYNYICAIGRFGLVPPLTNCNLSLPNYIIGDEKHSKNCSQPIYLPTITSGLIIWHIDYCRTLEEDTLTQIYGNYIQEAQIINPEYQVKGVLTDGFTSTINSFSRSCIGAVIGICLLHASMLLSRKLKQILGEHAESYSKRFFNIFSKYNPKKLLPIFKMGQQIRRFKEKLQKETGNKTKGVIEWINRKKKGWMQTVQIDAMPKTTTLLDQAHNTIDRKIFMMKKFHHNGAKHVRHDEFIMGFAMLHNIVPYQKRAKNAGRTAIEVEGGKLPTNNWMLNMQILISGGYRYNFNNTT